MGRITCRLRLAGLWAAYLCAASSSATFAFSGMLQAGASSTQSATAPTSPNVERTLIDRYCVSCHNDTLKTAGLTLQHLDVEQIGNQAEVLEKVVGKLRSGAMPPAGRPRPDPASSAALVTRLEVALDRAAEAAPNPGRSPIHRLNRAEYTNAIRDLLGLELDGRALLPADDSSYGSDNIAAALSISPGLLDRYLLAARKISRLAVGDPTMLFTETYKNSTIFQNDRMSEDLPFGSRGGTAIRHYFPLDGEYTVKIWMHKSYQSILGDGARNSVDVRVDGIRVGLPIVGGDRGKSTAGLYGPGSVRGAAPDVELRLPIKAGARLVGVSFLETKPWAVESVNAAYMPTRSISFSGGRDAPMSVESIEINGPFNASESSDTPSRRQIFVCQPAGETAVNRDRCATTILSRLARRAYRRPVSENDLQPLLSLYRATQPQQGFTAAIGRALEAILASPEFLFRRERDPATAKPGAPYHVSDVELASRLSFFLWSSIPDEQLLTLAEGHRLAEPHILERQVRRMLADPRAKALSENFGGQWWHLRNLGLMAPDPETFPDFDENLREAFQRETELFLESQIREDRPVPELLAADYTFVNERLAYHYGIPNVYGSHYRRIQLPDTTRGGLLSQGSILTVTSYPTRTSPVLRGKWVLENVLGAPPPPPPPNVPPLRDDGEGVKATSVRERLEQHRRNPICASCHARMDPIGFSLENYDAIGRWRTTSEADTEIDASGVLPDGTSFQGPAELRKLLLSRQDEFVTAVSEKLLIYALGRGLEPYDMPAVRSIRRAAVAQDCRWSAIILGIVKTKPFQMRRAVS